jgi:hypothetical protein
VFTLGGNKLDMLDDELMSSELADSQETEHVRDILSSLIVPGWGRPRIATNLTKIHLSCCDIKCDT